jgi:hypothetical protein
VDLGFDYALATVSEVVVHLVHVREDAREDAVQCFVHGEVVVVRDSLHGEMVVRYLVHRWVVQLFGGEVAVYLHVRKAAGLDLLLISLTMCCHWRYVYPLWEEEEGGV